MQTLNARGTEAPKGCVFLLLFLVLQLILNKNITRTHYIVLSKYLLQGILMTPGTTPDFYSKQADTDTHHWIVIIDYNLIVVVSNHRAVQICLSLKMILNFLVGVSSDLSSEAKALGSRHCMHRDIHLISLNRWLLHYCSTTNSYLIHAEINSEAVTGSSPVSLNNTSQEHLSLFLSTTITDILHTV